MPTKSIKNPCIRCGKERVFAKSWEEEIVTYTGSSMVKRALYICPDEKCQTKVEATLAERKKVAQERNDMAEQRKKDRITARSKVGEE